jgi:hypothetical protein
MTLRDPEHNGDDMFGDDGPSLSQKHADPPIAATRTHLRGN